MSMKECRPSNTGVPEFPYPAVPGALRSKVLVLATGRSLMSTDLRAK